jgi:nucleoside-diphosphate-sugar epimerase
MKPDSTTPHSVLVTGCAGFIGSRVVEVLLEEGIDVVGVDNLNNAYDPRLKEWRLARMLGRPGFRFHALDISNASALAEVFERRNGNGNGNGNGGPPFDGVINLAARAGVRQSVENPSLYYETNVTGTLNLLELCRRRGVPKFVLASTSSVYGASLEPHFSEEAVTRAPLSPYAASKKAAECLCYTYHFLYGLDVTIPRYFTVYGPAGRPDMSLFRFVQGITEGRPVVVYGDGLQTRDFTYVDDIARGTRAALRPMGYEIVNLGSDTPIVLEEAIHLIESMVGRRAEITHEAAHAADVKATWADIGKAERKLDWRPRTPFAEGVQELVSWYFENRSWAREVATS